MLTYINAHPTLGAMKLYAKPLVLALALAVAPLVPANLAWAKRWCPVTHYNGDKTTKGWVKARYVRDSECP